MLIFTLETRSAGYSPFLPAGNCHKETCLKETYHYPSGLGRPKRDLKTLGAILKARRPNSIHATVLFSQHSICGREEVPLFPDVVADGAVLQTIYHKVLKSIKLLKLTDIKGSLQTKSVSMLLEAYLQMRYTESSPANIK